MILTKKTQWDDLSSWRVCSAGSVPNIQEDSGYSPNFLSKEGQKYKTNNV
jgi:hypothetical protein